MFWQAAIFCFVFGVTIRYSESLECYSCTNASRLTDCTSSVQCASGSACFSDVLTVQGHSLYTLGCKSAVSCSSAQPTSVTPTLGSYTKPTMSTIPAIIGRATSSTQPTCSKCCSTGHCNRQLCQFEDSTCIDKQDCVAIGANFNICGDTSHSKVNCKRFCGFCSLVDGDWSSWGEWSSCDVTCGQGVKTKQRTCTNPVPRNGGSYCTGSATTNTNCSKDVCPTHGGWSLWSGWGSCSVTCDIGLQRRDRSCSRPYPSHSGDHCFGDSRDDRLCFPGACANGNWSPWGQWGACTRSCGGGVTTRNRDCNNPAPSLTGRDCTGDPMQSDSCNASPCKAMIAVGFTLTQPRISSLGYLTFSQVISNVGAGFNVTTGVFTCSIPGYYVLSAFLVKEEFYNNTGTYCQLSRNGVDLAFVYTKPYDSNRVAIGNFGVGDSVYVHLGMGDTVTLRGCSAIASFDEDTSFSGFLVTPDIV